MTTSTPARANSPASINPVGPPPAITTECCISSLPPSAKVGDPAITPRPYSKPRMRYTLKVGGMSAFFLNANSAKTLEYCGVRHRQISIQGARRSGQKLLRGGEYLSVELSAQFVGARTHPIRRQQRRREQGVL